jgi:hypothetical protein
MKRMTLKLRRRGINDPHYKLCENGTMRVGNALTALLTGTSIGPACLISCALFCIVIKLESTSKVPTAIS